MLHLVRAVGGRSKENDKEERKVEKVMKGEEGGVLKGCALVPMVYAVIPV